MNNKKHILHVCILTIACLVCGIFADQTPHESAPIEMTPEQFDASVQMDKIDLALDEQLNLSSEIDTINSSPSNPMQEQAENPAILEEKPAESEAEKKDEQEQIIEPSEPLVELIEQTELPLELQQPAVPVVTQRKPAGLTPVRKKKRSLQGEEASIEFHFEDADLQNLLDYMADMYDVTFLTNDLLNPLPKTGKAVKGNKISFKTHKPLTKKEAWDLFLSFLDIAGLAVVPEGQPKVYKIIQTEAARKAPLPAYIGVKPDTLPDNDQIIRYVYFIENSSIATVKDIVESLRSPASAFLVLNDLNGFILTDKSYNIKSLMKIITELDRVSMPQSMSILKLRRADASEVKALYDNIIQADDASIANRLFPARKQPTALYFPENTRIIAEPRSNALILLGPPDAIKKIEEFITTYVDVELGKLYSPLRVYQLKFADCTTIASIMNDLTQFGKDTAAGKVGGVRDEDKYLKRMTFTPEPATNSIVVRGDEEDYQRAKEILDTLDEAQPQVAMEVLIVSVDLESTKQLGGQVRRKIPGTDGFLGNVTYQTSGINLTGVGSSIVTNNTGPGVNRLLGNLINLVSGTTPGNTVVSLGSDVFGVWGIMAILDTISNTQVVSNPFLVTTNKKKAFVSVGQLRRVISGTVVGGGGSQNSFANDEADLKVTLTPQINSDGMIVLDIDVVLDVFTNSVDLSDATKNTKEIKTTTIVADKEVLALGGLIQNTVNNSMSKVPVLGNIPIIGWLFKNRQKVQNKSNLLVLVSTRIIQPEAKQLINEYTQKYVGEYQGDLTAMTEKPDKRDPIARWFFDENHADSAEKVIDDYLFQRKTKHDKKKEKKSAETIYAKKDKKSRRKANALIAPIAPPTPVPAPVVAQNNVKAIQRPKRSLLSVMNHDSHEEAA